MIHLHKNKSAHIVNGFGFGDEGKGATVHFIARHKPVHTVIRFGGGSQPGHGVVLDDGREHVFSQIGSATFLPHVETFLSRYMMVNPSGLLVEAKALSDIGVADVLKRISICRRALITTPFHIAMNRLNERMVRDKTHGTCGLGIGNTMSDFLDFPETAIYAGDLAQKDVVKIKLCLWFEAKQEQIQLYKVVHQDNASAQYDLSILDYPKFIEKFADDCLEFSRQLKIVDENHIKTILDKPGDVIFEGTQGVLLDEWYGFHPHTTWSTVTAKNALDLLLGENYNGWITRYGVLRAYATRHGAGPFVTEDSSIGEYINEPNVLYKEWIQGFRFGWFDAVATRYAMKANGGVDAIVLNCLDQLALLPQIKVCNSYQIPVGDDCIEEHHIPFKKYEDTNKQLAHQTDLTKLMFDTQPVYSVLDKDTLLKHLAQEYIELIQYIIGAEVRIAGYGRKAIDRRFV